MTWSETCFKKTTIVTMWRVSRSLGARPEAGKHCNNLKDGEECQVLVINFHEIGRTEGVSWEKEEGKDNTQATSLGNLVGVVPFREIRESKAVVALARR